MAFIRSHKKFVGVLLAILILAACCVGVVFIQNNANAKRYSAAFFAMSTVIDQRAYGPRAEQAMQAYQEATTAFENTLSLYRAESDVARINAAAGKQPVLVTKETLILLQQAKALALASENAFALTIAPLSTAWGVSSDTPHVLSQQEIEALLPLVNDEDLILDMENSTAFLRHEGQAIDLGGVAKGTACNVAKDIYNEYGVKSALLSIGGNVYAKGTRPDGTPYRIGFRDPNKEATVAIASFTMQDAVFAVSGGYERFFEEDGIAYHHIFDPVTGAPAQSDIVSVGVLHEDGTVADFYSTTLFVWGVEKALAYMQNGGIAIVLDNQNRLFVSKALQNSFQMVEDAASYQIVFI